MKNLRWKALRGIALVGMIVGLTGCGVVGKLLFPPVSGTFVDSNLEFTHCGVLRDRGQLTVFVAPSAQDENLSSFTVTVQLPDYGENGLIQRFEWIGKHPGSHPGGGASVAVNGDTATGRVSFMHACASVDGEPAGADFIEIVFDATRNS